MEYTSTGKNLYKLTAWILTVALVCLLSVASHAAESTIRVGDFSRLPPGSPLPTAWQRLTFKKIKQHTQYRFVDDDGQTVVRADSRNSASGLIRKVSIDPREFKKVSWRWKTGAVYKKGDVSRKDGDDYAARLYITFAYDPGQVGFFEKTKYEAARLIYGETLPLAAISYIWANRAPAGLMVANAYTERVKMIVLQSGADRTGRWIEEKRDVYTDFKKAFGREPTLISGVAIMTDSDNTGESTRTWYADIVFSKN